MKTFPKAKTYTILEDCIESGVNGGWNKAHKHNKSPDEHQIKENIIRYIMLEISEKFKLE